MTWPNSCLSFKAFRENFFPRPCPRIRGILKKMFDKDLNQVKDLLFIAQWSCVVASSPDMSFLNCVVVPSVYVATPDDLVPMMQPEWEFNFINVYFMFCSNESSYGMLGLHWALCDQTQGPWIGSTEFSPPSPGKSQSLTDICTVGLMHLLMNGQKICELILHQQLELENLSPFLSQSWNHNLLVEKSDKKEGNFISSLG